MDTHQSAQTPAATVRHYTRNQLPTNAKSVSIAVLGARLADGIDLALAIKQAHWNLKGAQFIAIHEMLDGFRGELDGWNDTVAERIVQLGGQALGTVQAVAQASSLAAYPLQETRIVDHLAALIERYAQFANVIRANIDEVAEAGDADTADIFTATSRGLDKQLWFLEAHLEPKSAA